MPKCRKCGEDTYGSLCCPSCQKKWSDMRKQALAYFQTRHGKLCPENLKTIQAGIVKLEKIWKKSPEEFQKIVGGDS